MKNSKLEKAITKGTLIVFLIAKLLQIFNIITSKVLVIITLIGVIFNITFIIIYRYKSKNKNKLSNRN